MSKRVPGIADFGSESLHRPPAVSKHLKGWDNEGNQWTQLNDDYERLRWSKREPRAENM